MSLPNKASAYEESRNKLRAMEVESYSKILSVFRAKGSLNKDRRKLLKQIASFLNVSPELHRAEARKASNDQVLADISYRLTGSSSKMEWLEEGRRLVPVPVRLPHFTAAAPLADYIASVGAVGEKCIKLFNKTKVPANESSVQETNIEATPESGLEKEWLKMVSNLYEKKRKKDCRDSCVQTIPKPSPPPPPPAPPKGCTYCKRRKLLRKKRLESKASADTAEQTRNYVSERVEMKTITAPQEVNLVPLPCGKKILVENTCDGKLDYMSATIIAQEVEVETECQLLESVKEEETVCEPLDVLCEPEPEEVLTEPEPPSAPSWPDEAVLDPSDRSVEPSEVEEDSTMTAEEVSETVEPERGPLDDEPVKESPRAVSETADSPEPNQRPDSPEPNQRPDSPEIPIITPDFTGLLFDPGKPPPTITESSRILLDFLGYDESAPVSRIPRILANAQRRRGVKRPLVETNSNPQEARTKTFRISGSENELARTGEVSEVSECINLVDDDTPELESIALDDEEGEPVAGPSWQRPDWQYSVASTSGIQPTPVILLRPPDFTLNRQYSAPLEQDVVIPLDDSSTSSSSSLCQEIASQSSFPEPPSSPSAQQSEKHCEDYKVIKVFNGQKMTVSSAVHVRSDGFKDFLKMPSNASPVSKAYSENGSVNNISHIVLPETVKDIPYQSLANSEDVQTVDELPLVNGHDDIIENKAANSSG